MDPQRFDSLVRALTTGSSRRRLLGVLAVLPGVGSALVAVADDAQAKGKGRGKGKGKGKARSAKARRRKRTREQRDRQNAKANAQACPLCQRPNAQGKCAPDHAVQGKCCAFAGGQRGKCLSGRCWPGTCSGPICNDQTCPTGCCDAAAQCHVNDADACGTGGEVCAPCDVAGEVCQGGDCVCPSGVICSVSGCCPNASDVCNDDDECCSKTTCAAQNAQCGTIADGCDGTLDCGGCPTGQTCGGGGVPNQCGCNADSCPDGCCDSNGQCRVDNDFSCATGGVACSTAVACAGDQVCRAGACIACATACPDCLACLRLIDGTNVCTNRITSLCSSSPCSLTSCGGGTVCTLSLRDNRTNNTTVLADFCGKPAGSGACIIREAC